MVICQVIYPRCTYTTRFVHMLKDRLCVYTFCIDEQFIPSDRWLPGCISTVSWRIKVRMVASYNRDLIKSNQPLEFFGICLLNLPLSPAISYVISLSSNSPVMCGRLSQPGCARDFEFPWFWTLFGSIYLWDSGRGIERSFLTVELQAWTFFEHMWRTSTRNWRPVDAYDKPVDTICSAWRVTGCNQRVPWHRGYDSLSILLRCQCRSLWGGHNILETLSGSKRWQKQ